MPNTSMTNANTTEEDEETWVLARAFAEDTRNTHWPPKSYSCTFCKKEFRSAQALGGHMNVHRHDRARLHVQAQGCSMTTGPTPLFYDQLANHGEGNVLPIVICSYYTGMQASEVVTEREHEKEAPIIEELDLELRLGHTTTTTASSNVSVVNYFR